MASKRQRGWWYPWIFVGFFVVIVSVNGVMMYFAFSSWTGLETTDHYTKGLSYDDNVAGARRQAALGWDVSFDFESSVVAGDTRRITYKTVFLDHNKKPVESLRAHVYFIRPTSEGLDKDQTGEILNPGVVSGEIELDVPGQWEVRVHAVSQERQYQFVERIVVK